MTGSRRDFSVAHRRLNGRHGPTRPRNTFSPIPSICDSAALTRDLIIRSCRRSSPLRGDGARLSWNRRRLRARPPRRRNPTVRLPGETLHRPRNSSCLYANTVRLCARGTPSLRTQGPSTWRRAASVGSQIMSSHRHSPSARRRTPSARRNSPPPRRRGPPARRHSPSA
jgi:hypothetical protein